MTNTDYFYSTAANFQNKRKEIMDAYEKRMKALEDTRGSRYYTEEAQKAEETRDAGLKALRAEYGEKFNSSLRLMQDANAKRGTVAPTEEELRIVQALKMRDSVTEGELTAIANALKNSPLCLSIVQETAAKNGILRNYKGFYNAQEMPVEYAETALKTLSTGLRDFIQADTRKAARIAQERQERLYGSTQDARPLPKRALFQTKEECFREIAGLEGAEYRSFCAAVDE